MQESKVVAVDFIATDAWMEECIARMAEGDQSALCTLYERLKSSVYGFALSLVRTAQDAEDVLQDTFVRLYTAASEYRAEGKPMAWILTITKNFSYMKLRERKKTASPAEEESFISDHPSVQLSSEERLLLNEVLGKLSQQDSQIVILHAVSGFKHREIADLLKLPLSTVLSRYNRSLKKLREFLTKEEER